ncbi:hypothetical protein ACKX2L_10450 [Lachnospiraceae bacterium YH-ros2228]
MSMPKQFIKTEINRIDNKRKLNSKYKFFDRKKNKKYALIVLSGYRNFLWKAVFGRIKKFCPDDIDVCIITSGLFSEELSKICDENDWSYLSTQKNQLCIAQNIALKIFDRAEYIYKLDEDMFITKEFFLNMRETYSKVKKEGLYDIGFVSPLTPINGYGYIRLLKKFDKLSDYEKRFGKAVYGGNNNSCDFISNKDVPFFMNSIPEFQNIDTLSNTLNIDPFNYSVCPVRYNIGAIFFKRDVWKDMGMFSVPHGGVGLGIDESDLNSYCICNSKAMIISENCAVAHFGYGAQVSDKLINAYKKREKEYLVD